MQNGYHNARPYQRAYWVVLKQVATLVVTLGLHKPGGGCTGCAGVTNAWLPRWFRERRGFWSYPPSLKRPNILRVAEPPWGSLSLVSLFCLKLPVFVLPYVYTANELLWGRGGSMWIRHEEEKGRG